ncbi:thioredoxin [Listeria fleischmannii 1991]|uniref:Thioredoxin n=4 Tax=Listeria fleischmannii TaxID=1069827 RepID=A0A2X3J090_9LIST|nr:thioredoxin [Listeria fleischmannii]EIA19955.1 thioredoxin [Listeria fleischmannii subsp. coloradonensis]EMG27492.1 thioredoxin [Listeria fleischmannii subsp. fleischmannii LU2006-1]EUJ53547.1 thioredoxin [Listeria fleischmannii FSL S10-1203]KMT61004.1 thioredoxin [Listeria fleischmannii 1991]MBC1397378.1 thioredoxin [Listeria fleischmannii]
MANIQEITDANFEQETSEGLVLTDFWATWCGPCRMVAPVLEEIANERGDSLKIVKMDVDENQETPSKFGVMSIPTLLIKKDGEVVDTIIGYRPKEELDEVINKYV